MITVHLSEFTEWSCFPYYFGKASHPFKVPKSSQLPSVAFEVEVLLRRGADPLLTDPGQQVWLECALQNVRYVNIIEQ